MNQTTQTAPAPSLVPPVVAGVVVAALGPWLWMFCYQRLRAIWLAAVLIGVGVGLAMRLVGRSDARIKQAVAAVLTGASCIIGYLATVMRYYIKPDPAQPVTLGDAATALVGDLFSVVLIAVAAYLAYILARRRLTNVD